MWLYLCMECLKIVIFFYLFVLYILLNLEVNIEINMNKCILCVKGCWKDMFLLVDGF